MTAIDPDKLSTCLQVLADVESLPPEHPDAVAVRRATAGIFKSVKQARRHAKRDAVAAADRAVDRRHRDRRARPHRRRDAGHAAGVQRGRRRARAPCSASRACYICKNHYTVVDAFYHQLCPDCAALNQAKRDARTDLTGRRALLTGGRAKIGMYIALRLLRDGAHTTITTRFPERRRAPLRRDAGQRRLAAPAARRRHRPARPGPGRRARRHGRRAAARWTS